MINIQPAIYPFKAYFSKFFSYPQTAKTNFLQSSGWYEDTDGYFHGKQKKANGQGTDNDGLEQRMRLFQERDKTGGEFTTDYTTLIGRLHLDLNICEQGLIPGLKIRIKMKQANDKWRIFGDPDDVKTGAYHLEIAEAKLSR